MLRKASRLYIIHLLNERGSPIQVHNSSRCFNGNCHQILNILWINFATDYSEIDVYPFLFFFHFHGRMSSFGVELNRLLERSVRESKAVDTESLCIVVGVKVSIGPCVWIGSSHLSNRKTVTAGCGCNIKVIMIDPNPLTSFNKYLRGYIPSCSDSQDHFSNSVISTLKYLQLFQFQIYFSYFNTRLIQN